MRRTPMLTTATLATALAVAALAGCSSSNSSGGQKAAPSGSAGTPSSPAAATTAAGGKTVGHLTYTGDTSGSVDFKGTISCAVVKDQLIGVTAPASFGPKADVAPAFLAAILPSSNLALFVTPDKHSYTQQSSATGLTGRKTGGTWTAAVTNLRISATTATTSASQAVTVNGSLTCTKITSK